MKSLMTLCIMLAGVSSSLLPAGVSAQSFMEPGYSGITQFAQWSTFVYATTNSGINTPQWELGAPQLELKQFNPAIISGGGNIYSYSSDMSFELTGSSTTNLSRICLQLFTWGEAEALSNETVRLVLDSGVELAPTISTNFYHWVDDQGAYGAYHTLGYKLEWELGGNVVTNYAIRFETRIHSSLNELRLDTEAGPVGLPAPEAPVVSLDFSGTDPVVCFSGEPGVFYQLRSSESLTNALSNWSIVAGPVPGDGSDCMMTNVTVKPAAFYVVEAWRE
ncbi:hypothetical protein P4E94_07465 [Pontiellaceae bacterium B12219]|nr:hypothetical protein [Pontiellaceae bacterium B12219]